MIDAGLNLFEPLKCNLEAFTVNSIFKLISNNLSQDFRRKIFYIKFKNHKHKEYKKKYVYAVGSGCVRCEEL